MLSIITKRILYIFTVFSASEQKNVKDVIHKDIALSWKVMVRKDGKQRSLITDFFHSKFNQEANFIVIRKLKTKMRLS